MQTEKWTLQMFFSILKLTYYNVISYVMIFFFHSFKMHIIITVPYWQYRKSLIIWHAVFSFVYLLYSNWLKIIQTKKNKTVILRILLLHAWADGMVVKQNNNGLDYNNVTPVTKSVIFRFCLLFYLIGIPRWYLLLSHNVCLTVFFFIKIQVTTMGNR